jgi:hypothetical protein
MTDKQEQHTAGQPEVGDLRDQRASLIARGIDPNLDHLPNPQTDLTCRWLPIAQADKTITDVHEFGEVGMTISTSDWYWVRDEDGRVYEAAWSEGRYGREYWWDFEGQSPVDPVEFMPHPLDPRFALTTS